jgi:hypothetical protein
MDITPAPTFLPLPPTSPRPLSTAHSFSLRTPFDFSIMGPWAHDDDDASSNSSASVRSSNHNDAGEPKTRIGTYRGRPYYILDEEGLPYDPWFDLRSSKTLPLLKLLADGDQFDALSQTSDGKAEIADLFIKNLPPLVRHRFLFSEPF